MVPLPLAILLPLPTFSAAPFVAVFNFFFWPSSIAINPSVQVLPPQWLHLYFSLQSSCCVPSTVQSETIQISRWICCASEALTGCKSYPEHVILTIPSMSNAKFLDLGTWLQREAETWNGVEQATMPAWGWNILSCLTLSKPLTPLLFLWPSRCQKLLPPECTYRIHP